MRLLDLFCGQGGAAKGYADGFGSGVDITGVDVEPQPRYPFRFIQADALEFVAKHGHEFDFIHASPPCQRYSILAKRNKNANEHPDLIEPVRHALRLSGCSWVIENVKGSPLRKATILCGTMFPPLRVLRHRLFQASFYLGQPPKHGKHPLVHTFDKRHNHFGKTDQMIDFVQVTGGGNCSKLAASDAMGIGWMSKHGLNEAIPPAYTAWIAKQWKASK